MPVRQEPDSTSSVSFDPAEALRPSKVVNAYKRRAAGSGSGGTGGLGGSTRRGFMRLVDGGVPQQQMWTREAWPGDDNVGGR